MGGKSDILMIVAAIIMSILLGLAVAPSIVKSTDTSRIAVYNTEIGLIRKVAILWITDYKIDGSSTGITTSALESYTGLTLNGSGYLQSKVDPASGYTISSPAPNQIQITVQGITLVGAEDNIKTSQSAVATSVVDSTPGDGILVLTFNL